ncbi:adenylyltransferase/cytidyltransferase family protein [Halorussus gelatinilyticus]|uniref:Adenylyltransferase/cytidyltransferase family protein n=1 Tax=Halorussus gelatinilyticus TaxID=2937524 RepID=A0A8U0IM23_9EURY|nr:adenylyltransferase/cytidyltransferase family protein [Halorussus gelatinilyticus]UPW01422.1 adenylyltransferase/cytidyltransferase family protein [Halorussus gelatinilyticus]
MTRVVALGTFDLLHPGHVHYLREAARAGDELHVVVANGERLDHKDPVLPDNQRVRTVEALDPVTAAHPGDPDDVSAPVRRIDPDVLVLGGDQHHDEAEVAAMLEEWGVECAVRRASLAEAEGDAVYSSSAIVERILEEREKRVVGP